MNSTEPKLSPLLATNGLNLQAVFDLKKLPWEILRSITQQTPGISKYKQLILLGHGGTTFWSALKQSTIHSKNPVDDFSKQMVKQYFDSEQQGHAYHIVYPGPQAINLQALGKLAGWHHSSPFLLGINTQWGSWFAYRALILADTQLSSSTTWQSKSPCQRCKTKACISACPAQAISTITANTSFDIERCINYRIEDDSHCKHQCLSRNSCPVQQERRYSKEQIDYHYSCSLQTIKKMLNH